jgi:putative methyltransferase (TIGR04325 family)
MLYGYEKPLMQRALRVVKDAVRYIRFQSPDCRGMYGSFEEALQDIPRGGKVGYDHQEVASYYLKIQKETLSLSDYPMLYHLSQIMQNASTELTVLDFGGNIGVHYKRVSKHLDAKWLQWVVCDVASITRVGRIACANIGNLSFINEISEFNRSKLDILIASGSVQYIRSPDFLILSLKQRNVCPRHILFNAVAVSENPQFVTIQNGGPVYYPEYIFQREQFIESVTNVGYHLVDHWDCENDYEIPFYPGRVIKSEGFYFVQYV